MWVLALSKFAKEWRNSLNDVGSGGNVAYLSIGIGQVSFKSNEGVM